MKHCLTVLAAAALALGLTPGPVQAYTSKAVRTVSVGASGVTGTATLNVSLVTQGSGEPGTAAGSLVFEAPTSGTQNNFRDSGEALKLDVNTNVAGNRVIIYTNNLSGTASPQACLNTGLGNDGGGLVGNTAATCSFTVPMVWGLTDGNTNYTFTEVASPGVGATNGVFITDLAHVATFTSPANDAALDNLAMKRCSTGAAVTNTANDNLYPQFFGQAGQDFDLCRVSDSTKVLEAEELSKNIAVVAFGFNGTAGTAPDTTTASATDTIQVTSPIFVAMGADFRAAAGDVQYASSTLTVELVSQ